jgi:hypothetical protein
VPYGPPRHGERGADGRSHHSRLRRSRRSARGEDAAVVPVDHGCDAGALARHGHGRLGWRAEARRWSAVTDEDGQGSHGVGEESPRRWSHHGVAMP